MFYMAWLCEVAMLIGRCYRIRTCDPLAPSEVRYQTALNTDIIKG
jgi:hypothetical protein